MWIESEYIHISRAVKNFSTESIHPVLQMANIHFNNLEKFFSVESRIQTFLLLS